MVSTQRPAPRARRRRLSLALALLLLVTTSACGDDSDDGAATSTSEQTTSTQPSTTTSTSTTVAPTTEVAVWPAPDVTYATPEDAASSFVTDVLGVPAKLGSFRQGDARSGEVDVLGGEGASTTGPVRSTLLMRQLG